MMKKVLEKLFGTTRRAIFSAIGVIIICVLIGVSSAYAFTKITAGNDSSGDTAYSSTSEDNAESTSESTEAGTDASSEESSAASSSAENSSTSGSSNGSQSGSTAATAATTEARTYSSYISVDKAKSIATQRAGLSMSAVTFEQASLEMDDGIMVYEIEFYHGSKEYECTINAETGTIIEYDEDYWDD